MAESGAVLFAYGENLGNGRLLPGREQLFGKLLNEGLLPVVSTGAEQAFDGNSVAAERIVDHTFPGRTEPIGRLALGEEVKVVVDQTDHALPLHGLLPTLNEAAARQLGDDRGRVYQEVFKPLGMGLPTGLTEQHAGIEAFIGQNPSDKYALIPKVPHTLEEKEKAIRMPGPETVKWFRMEETRLGKYVIQPALDTRIPFPGDMRAYDQRDRDFGGLSKIHTAKEIRMYGFHSMGRTQVFPVGMINNYGSLTWFAVDPESVPVEVQKGATDAIDRAARLSGSVALFGAVTYVYGNRFRGSGPELTAVGMHLRAPKLIGYDVHWDAADKLHDLLAQMLVETARAK